MTLPCRLFLSARIDERLLERRAIEVGASAFVLKHRVASELLPAIHRVVAGRP